MKKISVTSMLLAVIFIYGCKKDELRATYEVFPQTAAVPGKWRQILDTSNIEIIQPLFFAIGNKGYTINQQTNEVYQFDTLNRIMQKKFFPGQRRQSGAVAFTIGNKGYYGFGVGKKSLQEGTQTVWQFQYLVDFWEYDPVADNWNQKPSLPVLIRYGVPSFIGAYGFGIGTKGYVGSGGDNTFTTVPYFFEYNQTTETWITDTTQADILNYGPQYSSVSIAFSIGTKGYVGDSTKLWEFNPLAVKKWRSLNPSPVSLQSPVIAIGGKTKGYLYGSTSSLNSVTPALKNEFYEYVPDAGIGGGTWNKLAAFAGQPRAACPAFFLNDRVYIGFGSNLSADVFGDMWEYTP
jgi:hypothetical protein